MILFIVSCAVVFANNKGNFHSPSRSRCIGGRSREARQSASVVPLPRSTPPTPFSLSSSPPHARHAAAARYLQRHAASCTAEPASRRGCGAGSGACGAAAAPLRRACPDPPGHGGTEAPPPAPAHARLRPQGCACERKIDTGGFVQPLKNQLESLRTQKYRQRVDGPR